MLISLAIFSTFLLLHFNAPDLAVVVVSILTGAPTGAINVVSYQFLAEVAYPISEVQAISIMNMANKLVSLGFVKLTSLLTFQTPEHVKFMHGFILWTFMPLIGLIPALLVEEDLRRLKFKDVKDSKYVEERAILA